MIEQLEGKILKTLKIIKKGYDLPEIYSKQDVNIPVTYMIVDNNSEEKRVCLPMHLDLDIEGEEFELKKEKRHLHTYFTIQIKSGKHAGLEYSSPLYDDPYVFKYLGEDLWKYCL